MSSFEPMDISNTGEQIVPFEELKFQPQEVPTKNDEFSKLFQYNEQIKALKLSLTQIQEYSCKKLFSPPKRLDKEEWFYEYSYCCSDCGVRNCLCCETNCYNCKKEIPEQIKYMHPENRLMLKEKFNRKWSYQYGSECSNCNTILCVKCSDICFKCHRVVCKTHYKTIEYNNRYYGICESCIP